VTEGITYPLTKFTGCMCQQSYMYSSRLNSLPFLNWSTFKASAKCDE